MRPNQYFLAGILTVAGFINVKAQEVQSEFSEVKIIGNFNVELKTADVHSVDVNGNSDGVLIKSENGVLSISGEADNNSPVDIEVFSPSYSSVSFTGNGSVVASDTLRAENFKIISSGTGDMELVVAVTNLNTSLTGTGDMTISGRAVNHDIKSTGTGDIDAGNLSTYNTKVDNSGTGDILVNASQKLSGTIAGTGDVTSVKQPKEVAIESSGTGDTSVDVNASKNDTTRLKLGEYKVTIIDENDKAEKDDDGKVDNTHWSGLDLGFSGYLNSNHGTSIPGEYNFLDLQHVKSFHVGLNFWERDFRLVSDYVKLVTGLGLEWNSYNFENNTILHTTSPITGTIDTIRDFAKSKLKTSYIQIPLLLQFNTSRDADKSFHLAAGVIGGYNFLTHQKMKFESEGAEVKMKVRNDFDVNPFKAAATVRVGYGDFNIYATYNLIPLFKSSAGPELYPYSIGITVLGL